MFPGSRFQLFSRLEWTLIALKTTTSNFNTGNEWFSGTADEEMVNGTLWCKQKNYLLESWCIEGGILSATFPSSMSESCAFARLFRVSVQQMLDFSFSWISQLNRCVFNYSAVSPLPSLMTVMKASNSDVSHAPEVPCEGVSLLPRSPSLIPLSFLLHFLWPGPIPDTTLRPGNEWIWFYAVQVLAGAARRRAWILSFYFQEEKEKEKQNLHTLYKPQCCLYLHLHWWVIKRRLIFYLRLWSDYERL